MESRLRASKNDYYDRIRSIVGASLDEAHNISFLAVHPENETNGGEIFFQHSR